MCRQRRKQEWGKQERNREGKEGEHKREGRLKNPMAKRCYLTHWKKQEISGQKHKKKWSNFSPQLMKGMCIMPLCECVVVTQKFNWNDFSPQDWATVQSSQLEICCAPFLLAVSCVTRLVSSVAAMADGASIWWLQICLPYFCRLAGTWDFLWVYHGWLTCKQHGPLSALVTGCLETPTPNSAAQINISSQWRTRFQWSHGKQPSQIHPQKQTRCFSNSDFRWMPDNIRFLRIIRSLNYPTSHPPWHRRRPCSKVISYTYLKMQLPSKTENNGVPTSSINQIIYFLNLPCFVWKLHKSLRVMSQYCHFLDED